MNKELKLLCITLANEWKVSQTKVKKLKAFKDAVKALSSPTQMEIYLIEADDR